MPTQPGYTFKHGETRWQRYGPQVGAQLGLAYGNFSLGVSTQWVVTDRHTFVDRTSQACNAELCNGSEEQENSSRRDIDYSAAYTFRDVVSNFLNVSTGLTLFTVHVDSDSSFTKDPRGLVGFVRKDGSLTGTATTRSSGWALGPTLGLTFRLTDRWLLPVNTSVAWGEFSQSDNLGTHDNDRAVFLRNDLGVRYVVSDQVSLYAAYKTQFASTTGAHDYLVHGPVFGLTVRFGLR